MADHALVAPSELPAPPVIRRLALVPPARVAGLAGGRHGRYAHVAACSHQGPPGTCQERPCRYHLAHRGHSEHQLTPSRDCALDVANEGPHTREQVAAVLGLSDERLRQIEKRALGRLKRNETLRRLHDESF
ncbi:MAG TPA: sigma factor-like helix-turn-helix DNA-binding protein [Polyangiaceae bacterium]|nr:sigma factor-like helix-turn-helix DNA-binding protein [Polyangiaceae bacterium]